LEQHFAFARGKDVAVLWSALFAGRADVTQGGARHREGPSTENWLANPVVIRAEALPDYPPKLEFDLP
jgi:hypothetical protein